MSKSLDSFLLLPAVSIFLVDINVPSQADPAETVTITPVGNK